MSLGLYDENTTSSYYKSDSMYEPNYEEESENLTDSLMKIFTPVRNEISTQEESGEFMLFLNKEEEPQADYKEVVNSEERTETIIQEDSSNIFDRPEIIFQTVKTKKEKPSHRKMEDDSIRKKFKTHCEESIRLAVNQHLKKIFPKENLAFNKLPQNFLSNPKIEVNKKSLEMDILSRYSYDFMEDTGNDMNLAGDKKLKSNKDIIKKLRKDLKYNVNEDKVLIRKVKDLVFDFINSQKYRDELVRIEISDGHEYRKRYELVTKGDSENLGYIDYYLKSRGNKHKHKHNHNHKQD
jgi:hypothetical protein